MNQKHSFYEQKVGWVTDGRSGPIRLLGLLEHKKHSLQLYKYIQEEMIYDHVVTMVCLELAPVGLGTCKQQCIATLMSFYQREDESNFKC